jgi:large subunit ribosomal protein L32e
MPKFLRRTWTRYSKLGKKRKKKQIWKRPTGRDNKMREKRRGYPIIVSVGYQGEKKVKGKLQGKKPIIVKNLQDLKNLKKEEIGIVGSIGKKKRIEIAKKAKEMKINLYNMNPSAFLKKNEKKKKEKDLPSKTEQKKEPKREIKEKPKTEDKEQIIKDKTKEEKK